MPMMFFADKRIDRREMKLVWVLENRRITRSDDAKANPIMKPPIVQEARRHNMNSLSFIGDGGMDIDPSLTDISSIAPYESKRHSF